MKTYDKELIITVSGKAGHGKSTIAALIYNTLKANGISVSFHDDEDKIDEERLKTQLAFNVDTFNISVETRHIKREVFNNS